MPCGVNPALPPHTRRGHERFHSLCKTLTETCPLTTPSFPRRRLRDRLPSRTRPSRPPSRPAFPPVIRFIDDVGIATVANRSRNILTFRPCVLRLSRCFHHPCCSVFSSPITPPSVSTAATAPSIAHENTVCWTWSNMLEIVTSARIYFRCW